MATMPLTNIVNVSVQVSPLSAIANALNIGLIVGSSIVIPATTRTVQYASTAAMLTAGWAGTEPEYLAAQVYFSQSPRPVAVIIGRQDLTATETVLAAVQACRIANANWYGLYVTGNVKADILAVAGFIETATPLAVFFYDTKDADILPATAGNVMATLQTSTRHRTLGIYSNTTYAAAAVMGYAMGANTSLLNSSYTLAYKTLPGVTPEPLTNANVAAILAYNGNVYTNYGSTYNLLVQGTMADGTYFDQILNIDVITVSIQTAIMNVLTTNPKVPYTDAGVAMLVNAVAGVCQVARNVGAIAPGVWTAAPILNLKTGDALSNGYLVLADTVANQSTANKSARIFPGIYTALKMAGAIEHVTIGVVVNQ